MCSKGRCQVTGSHSPAPDTRALAGAAFPQTRPPATRALPLAHAGPVPCTDRLPAPLPDSGPRPSPFTAPASLHGSPRSVAVTQEQPQSPPAKRTPGQAAPAAPPGQSPGRRDHLGRHGGSGPGPRMWHPRKRPASGGGSIARPQSRSPFGRLQDRPAPEPLFQHWSFRPGRGEGRKQCNFRFVLLQTWSHGFSFR